MATTEAGICNIALLRVGQRQTIDALDDDTEEAEACNELYADARDAVLAEQAWKFATRRAVLAELDEERTGWGYVYSLPTDCLAPRFIHPGTNNPAADERIPYDIELNDDGDALVLLTNQSEAELVYTAKVTAVTRFPPLFVDALAWKLAADLALALPVKPQVGLAMQQGYRQAMLNAAGADSRGSQEEQPADSETIRARG